MGLLAKMLGIKNFDSFMGVEFSLMPANDARFKPVQGMDDEYLFSPTDEDGFGFKVHTVTVTPYSRRIACIGAVSTFGAEDEAVAFFDEVRQRLVGKYSEFGAMKPLPGLPGAVGWIVKVCPGEYRNIVLTRSTPTSVNVLGMDCLNNDIRKEEMRTGKPFDA